MISYTEFLGELPGRRIGLVYPFPHSDATKSRWYDRWRSAVIGIYGEALDALGVDPYYVEAQDFVERCMSGRLPDLYSVINLTVGTVPVGLLGLVPAAARWANIPLAPCSGDAMIIGERKDAAGAIAEQIGFRIPRPYWPQYGIHPPFGSAVVLKPRDLGSSVGIRRQQWPDDGDIAEPADDVPFLVQEFIPGFDVTVPLLASPEDGQLECLPGVIYLPDKRTDGTWFHDAESKRQGVGYTKQTIELPADVATSVERLAQQIGAVSISRVDFRLAKPHLDQDNESIMKEDLIFLEINTTPTLKRGINFFDAILSASLDGSDYQRVRSMIGADQSQELVAMAYIVSILLWCSVKAMYGKSLELSQI